MATKFTVKINESVTGYMWPCNELANCHPTYDLIAYRFDTENKKDDWMIGFKNGRQASKNITFQIIN